MFKRQFTDVYGTSHLMAIFEVSNVNVYTSANRSVYMDEGNDLQEELSANGSIEFSARFWVSQEAKNMGALPMSFSMVDPADGMEKTLFELTTVENPHELTKEQLVAEAEKEMINIVTQGQE